MELLYCRCGEPVNVRAAWNGSYYEAEVTDAASGEERCTRCGALLPLAFQSGELRDASAANRRPVAANDDPYNAPAHPSNLLHRL